MRRFLFLSFMVFSFSAFGYSTNKEVDFNAMRKLKVHMDKFVKLVADLEDNLRDNAHPNWTDAESKIQSINTVIGDLKKSDEKGIYKNNISDLQKAMDNVAKKIEKQDVKVGRDLDKLTDTCLSCHLTHRPMDIDLKKSPPHNSTHG